MTDSEDPDRRDAQGVVAAVEAGPLPPGGTTVEELGNLPPGAETATAGWVLYDDACGFCRRWIPIWEETLARRGFGVAPLQAGWVRAMLSLTDDELLDDLRLLRPDGGQIAGADVYRHCMRRIWWAWPIWLFSVLPLGRQVFDWSYRTFARNRYAVSDACQLPGGEEDA